MPPSLSEVSEEVRVAFFLHSMLSDRWDGTAGIYLGKDISALSDLMEIFEIENRQIVTLFLMRIQKINSDLINKDLERKRKAQERKNGK